MLEYPTPWPNDQYRPKHVYPLCASSGIHLELRHESRCLGLGDLLWPFLGTCNVFSDAIKPLKVTCSSVEPASLCRSGRSSVCLRQREGEWRRQGSHDLSELLSHLRSFRELDIMFEDGVPARKFKLTVVDEEDATRTAPTMDKEQREMLGGA